MLRKINLLIALTLLLAGGLKAQNHSPQGIKKKPRTIRIKLLRIFKNRPLVRSWSYLIVLIGVMPQRTRCKPFRTVLIWE